MSSASWRPLCLGPMCSRLYNPGLIVWVWWVCLNHHVAESAVGEKCLGSKKILWCSAVLLQHNPLYLCSIDSFTVPLHSPNGRQLPAIRAVQRDNHWSLKNSRDSHWTPVPIMQWGTRQSQSIFRPTNHKRVMPANKKVWWLCLVPTSTTRFASDVGYRMAKI